MRNYSNDIKDVFEHIQNVYDSGIYYEFVKASKEYDEAEDLKDKESAKKRMDMAFAQIFKFISYQENKIIEVREYLNKEFGDICTCMPLQD